MLNKAFIGGNCCHFGISYYLDLFCLFFGSFLGFRWGRAFVDGQSGFGFGDSSGQTLHFFPLILPPNGGLLVTEKFRILDAKEKNERRKNLLKILVAISNGVRCYFDFDVEFFSG